MQIEDWIKENKLKAIVKGNFVEIKNVGLFLIIYPKKIGELEIEMIFDNNFSLIVSDLEKSKDVDFYLYEFGDNWYYCKKAEIKKPKLNIFKYLGQCEQEVDLPFTHLGVHGRYEIMNGIGNYTDWCKKATFYGYEGLGICEKNSLAGIIPFQTACDKAKIKPILGETISLRIHEGVEDLVKIFVTSKEGWKSLLKINKIINVDNPNNFITEAELLSIDCSELILVISTDAIHSFEYLKIQGYQEHFKKVYYQIDSVIWKNDKRDMEYLNTVKTYLETYFDLLPPIIINDSYYLNQNQHKLKRALNKIGTVPHQSDSEDQYFKNIDDILARIEPLFNEGDERLVELIKKGTKATKEVFDLCNFKIEIGKFHLPEFDVTPFKDEYGVSDNEELFLTLIEKGLKLKGLEDNDEYFERIKLELKVIKGGGFIDYFLILWDIIRWCETQNILTGIGRGSAAGSLISYLLNITRVDPIKYGLLFERFLNEGRIGKSLPDIDCDFNTSGREDVKRYMEQLYGENYVCSVGTYQTLKIKAGIKDMGKFRGVSHKTLNILTETMVIKEGKDGDFEEIFKLAQRNGLLRDFVRTRGSLINEIGEILNAPKSKSIHPCATIILPKYEGETIFDHIPMRIENGILVSEWEGPHLETAGYLKEDILGIKQLDKIKFILDLIKETTGKEIDIYNLPTEDANVMSFFKKGYNSDIFQFGSPGLTVFCKEVLPDKFEELVNMVALYRPGPISSGAHHDYINIKFGRKEPDYDYNLKEVTESTFGLYIFQEQVMKACQVLGGFNPVETDDIRKAMGKKISSLLEKFKVLFIKNALEKGCSENEAEIIWEKLEVFSGYGFNKSHAVCYALTGYISQWLKYYYPLQFWTSALQYVDEKDKKSKGLILRYMSEIKKTSNQIQIVPPDINNSDLTFKSDFKTSKIYWSLIKIKFLAEIGTGIILEERAKNGKFYSIEDFWKRVPKAKVNKRIIVNLILSGSFDEVGDVKEPKDRAELIKKYIILAGLKEGDIDELVHPERNNNWFWTLRQKELSGLGFLDFFNLIKSTPGIEKEASNFMEPYNIILTESIDKYVAFGGIVKVAAERKSAKGPWMMLTLDNNNEQVFVNIWNDQYEPIKDLLKTCIDKLVLFTNARVTWDNYKKENILSLTMRSTFKVL